MELYQQDFISNLKRYRKQAGFSQAKLSELCNVSTGTIGNIECGASKPSFDLILTISKVLNIHPAMLFSDKISHLLSINNESETTALLDRKLLFEMYEKLKSHLELKQ